MGRLFLKSGESFGTIGSQSTTNVFGTNGNETVFVAAGGKATFDPSFNRGGDTIEIEGNASLYTIVQSGSNILLTAANGANITIPIGSNINVNFADADRVLNFDGTKITLGTQQVTGTAAPVTPGQQAASAAEIEAPLSAEVQSHDTPALAAHDISHALALTQITWSGSTIA